MAEAGTVYHVELRQFPHNMCRFNLSLPELRAVVLEPWARERWIEFGERKWSPHQATLTVLEGPRIPFGQLTMGRGWRTAQREGREVTAELLAAVARGLESAGDTAGRTAIAEAPGAPSAGGTGGGAAGGQPTGGGVAQGAGGTGADEPIADGPGAGGTGAGGPIADGPSAGGKTADSLALELLSRIGAERAPLARAWELAGELHPDSSPSSTLALAERAVESLLRGGLIVLLAGSGDTGAGGREEASAMGEEEARRALAAIGSWGAEGAGRTVWMRRA